jgi:mono/diheme cytochrome c family protein
MKKSYYAISAIVITMAFVLMSFSFPQDKEYGSEWEIPAKYKNMENPHAGDKGLKNVGKSLYMKHCRYCHGNKAEGDGPKARMMNVKMRDLASEDVQKHTDGGIYFMSIIGRDEMPNYEKKIIEEEDRWAIVNYIRSMK